MKEEVVSKSHRAGANKPLNKPEYCLITGNTKSDEAAKETTRQIPVTQRVLAIKHWTTILSNKLREVRPCISSTRAIRREEVIICLRIGHPMDF